MGFVIAALVSVLAVPPAQPPVVEDPAHSAEVTRLRAVASFYGRERPLPLAVERLPLMARKVAWCESRYVNSASPATSTASGYFQFLNGTWEWVTGLPAPASAYPLEVQYAAFLELWDEGRGASHWNPSRYCWEKDNPWATY